MQKFEEKVIDLGFEQSILKRVDRKKDDKKFEIKKLTYIVELRGIGISLVDF
jgi:hypothetical protein